MIACTSPAAIARLTISVALASASAERSRASASRKAACRRPSASRICASRWPSALRIAACFCPSAIRMSARLSRSAFICRPIAWVMSGGGARSRISTRVTFTPHGVEAWSITDSSLRLIASRFDSASSRSIDPSTARMLVWLMFFSDRSSSFTS